MIRKLSFKAILFVVIAFYLSASQAIIIGDKDWRQVTETVNISWDQMDAIYDTTNGTLDGTSTSITELGGKVVDFAGYKWANVAEVTSMLSTLAPSLIPDISGNTAFIANSVWAPQIVNLSTAFTPTVIAGGFNDIVHILSGLTRDSIAATPSLLGIAVSVANELDPLRLDTFFPDARVPTFRQDLNRGHWVYTTVVPIPAAAWLMGTGIFGLIGFSRRNKPQIIT